MTTEIIPTVREEDGKQLVDARQLHTFLEVGRDFSNWLKGRIDRYGFIDGTDYITSSPDLASQSTNNLRGRMQPKVDYGLTLDMAKQLCMVENNEKGMEARKYFIECERIAKDSHTQIPGSFAEALRLAADQQEQIEEQQARLVIAAPKEEAYDNLMESKGFTLIGKAAKILDCEIGPNKLFEYLRNHGALLKKGRMYNAPNQDLVKEGWFKVKLRTFDKPDGSLGASSTTYITVKGIEGVRRMLKRDGYYDVDILDLSEQI